MNSQILQYITLLCYISSAFSYSLADNVLQDLESISDFNTDAESWTASRLFNDDTFIASGCDKAFLIGGYRVLGSEVDGGSQSCEYFQRNYVGLPSHTSINFRFEFYAIDSWEGTSGDTFQIAFDSIVLDGWGFRSQDATSSNTCGNTTSYDVPGVIIEGTVPHTGDSLVFKVISKLDQDSEDESFGFRDIKFTFSNVTPTSTTSTICARSPTVLPDTRKCSCSTNQYEYPTGSGNCITCDSTCATCSGSAGNQCLTCILGRYKSGTSCLACDTACDTCNGTANTCLSCKSGSYLNGVQCLKCHTDCATCVSGTSSSCETCPPGRYKSGNQIGQCSKCHASCATCNGGAETQCKTCPENNFLTDDGTCVPTCSIPLFETTDATTGIKYCKSPCSATNEYAYWDKSCSSTCASPLTETAIGTYKLCNYDCSLGEYLRWNGTCGACHAPLEVKAEKGKSFCHYKCELNEYLYWNGTCSTSCPFPLKTRTEGDKQYCDYPCTSSQYLLWDQTCVSSCLAPLQKEIVGDVRYCKFPCDSSMFAYWNGTCSSKGCSTPLTQRTEGTTLYQRKFCDLNCASNEFMHWTGICASTCNYPLKTGTYDNDETNPTCNPPCDSTKPYYFNDLRTCGKTCISPRSINESGIYVVCNPAPTEDQGGSLIFFMLNAPIEPHEYTVVVTGSTLDHIHYLDIEMPPRFEKLANSTGKSFLSPRFGLYAPKSFTTRRLLTSFVKYPLPYVFERSGLHSSFLINYWDALMTMAIILIIAISLKVLEIILRKTQLKTLHGVVERLMVMAAVNYFLVIFISSIPEIILYTSLEARSFLSHGFLNSSSDVISFVINIIMLLLVVAVFTVAILSVKKASDADVYDFNEKNAEDCIKFAIKWRSCQVLFRGFKSNNVVNKLFFPLYILRLSIPAIFSVCLINYPLIQTIIPVIVNLAMIIFLILKRPFKKRANLVQIILFEIITLILNLLVMLIAILSNYNIDTNHNITAVMGDIVIVGASILTLLRFVFLIIKAKIEADSIMQTLKEAPHKGIAVWVGLLSVLAQQTGIGFEQIFEERCISDSGNKYMGMLARPAAKQKAAQARNKRVYPDGVSDMEPILLQSNSSFPKIAESREGTPLATSMLMTNNELTPNNKEKPDPSANLKTRMKQRMANLKLRKDEEQKDSFPEPEQSPTYSIDVSDNSPDLGGSMLLKKSSSIDKPSPKIRRKAKGFFDDEVRPEEGDNAGDETPKVLTLFPVNFAEGGHK